MNLSARAAVFSVVVAFTSVFVGTSVGQVGLRAKQATVTTSPQSMSGSGFIHGTIVVVVATRDGFVLAGDSRGSHSDCTPVPGEFQKVFPVGKQSAIVVAGLISSNPADEISTAVATHLLLADRNTKEGDQYRATTAIEDFASSVKAEIALLDPDSAPSPAHASAVSIDERGIREWITVKFIPALRTDPKGGKYWSVRVEQFVDPPESKVLSLGAADDIVQQLIGRDAPDSSDPNSQLEIMRRYYSLKRENQLSQLTLEDGKALAEQLINVAIKFAAAHPYPCRGIGGSIEMLTITGHGTEWIFPPKKSELAPVPPMYRALLLNSSLYGGLDGIDCKNCTVPADAVVTFYGSAEVHVVHPNFEGACTFILRNDAEQKMPTTAQRLKSAFGKHCEVYRESNAGRLKLSSPTDKAQPPSAKNEYSSLSGPQLKIRAVDLAAAIKLSVADQLAWEQQQRDQEWFEERQFSADEDKNVVLLKYIFSSEDRYSDLRDNYLTQVLPKAISMRQEMMKRIHNPNEQGPDSAYRGTTLSEMVDVASDLSTLASKLPKD